MRTLVLAFILTALFAADGYAGMDDEIKYLFPDAVNGRDYIVQDDSDGKGPYIKEWNLQDSQPTKAELDAVAASATQAAVGRGKAARLNNVVFRAVIKFLANHHGMTEKQVRDELKSYME